MKKIQYKIITLLLLGFGASILNSCEGDLEPEIFDKFSVSTFYQTEADAKAAVTAIYTGLMLNWQGGYATAMSSHRFQQSGTTDELKVSWGGSWQRWSPLNYDANFWGVTTHYSGLLPKVTECTIAIEKIGQMENLKDPIKKQYIAELKALRAHFSQLLYGYYGPVSIVVDYEKANDPNSKPEARPTSDWMVSQIEKDYTEAAADLPVKFTGDDYGRFTKAACKMGLIKLYLKEKMWSKVITAGKEIEGMGFSLMDSYKDIFTIENERNNEIIFAIPCRMDARPNTNGWLAHVLPGDYRSPTGKQNVAWGGYKVPWDTYNKFDPTDKRLEVLLADYPIGNGETKRDPLGAIPIKYGEDPAATGWAQGVDLIVWRYADVLLSISEAENEINGPTSEAFAYVNRVRARAGLAARQSSDFTTKEAFRDMILDERLFELWCEGTRRDDLIRHGKYIQRARDEGSSFAEDFRILYPLPRKAIDESEGVITQNPGY